MSLCGPAGKEGNSFMSYQPNITIAYCSIMLSRRFWAKAMRMKWLQWALAWRPTLVCFIDWPSIDWKKSQKPMHNACGSFLQNSRWALHLHCLFIIMFIVPVIIVTVGCYAPLHGILFQYSLACEVCQTSCARLIAIVRSIMSIRLKRWSKGILINALCQRACTV